MTETTMMDYPHWGGIKALKKKEKEEWKRQKGRSEFSQFIYDFYFHLSICMSLQWEFRNEEWF